MKTAVFNYLVRARTPRVRSVSSPARQYHSSFPTSSFNADPINYVSARRGRRPRVDSDQRRIFGPALRPFGSPAKSRSGYHTSIRVDQRGPRDGVRALYRLQIMAIPPSHVTSVRSHKRPPFAAKNATAAVPHYCTARFAGIFASMTSRCLSLSLSVNRGDDDPGATTMCGHAAALQFLGDRL